MATVTSEQALGSLAANLHGSVLRPGEPAYEAARRQTVNAIETERYTPSLPLALALAKYFDDTVERLFSVDDTATQGGT